MPTNADLATIRFSPSSPASRIAKLPILVDLLDQQRLAALVSDVTRARSLAADAGTLASQGQADLTGMIDAGIREGLDAAKLVDKIVKARTATAARKDAADLLDHAARRLRDNLEHWIDDQAFDLIDVLSDKLEDLLNRSEEVVTALDGVRTADEAVEADKAAEWRQWRALHRDYQDLRSAHIALLRSTEPGKFGGDTYTLAFAFFQSPTRAWPQLGAAHHGHIRTGGLDAHGVPASPFDLQDPSDTEHFLAAVTRRAELGTHVVDAEHALTEWGRIIKESVPRDSEGFETGGDLQRYHGSEKAVVRMQLGR